MHGSETALGMGHIQFLYRRRELPKHVETVLAVDRCTAIENGRLLYILALDCDNENQQPRVDDLVRKLHACSIAL